MTAPTITRRRPAFNRTRLGTAVTQPMPDGTYEVVADARFGVTSETTGRTHAGLARVRTTVRRLGRHFVVIGPDAYGSRRPWETRPAVGPGRHRTLQDAVEGAIAEAYFEAVASAHTKRRLAEQGA